MFQTFPMTSGTSVAYSVIMHYDFMSNDNFVFQIWIGGYAFLVWMGFTILISLYVWFFIPGTGGKTSDEIQAFFKKSGANDESITTAL